MQATRFPVFVIRELDSLSRRFLWGAGEGEQKFHPVKWEVACTPKDEGGLGLPSLACFAIPPLFEQSGIA